MSNLRSVVVADFTHPQPVAVLGLGTVGWPVAQAVAAAGHPVLGFDIDTGRVATLRQELAGHLPAGRMHLVTRPAALAAAGTYLICAPTDVREGRPELAAVLTALDLIAGLLRPGDLVAVESTLPPGATAQLLAPRLAGRSGLTPGTDFALVYAPERLDPGNAHFGVRNTPKLLGGLTPACTGAGRIFYETVVETVTAVTSAEAELAKLLENSFRQVNVALVNELAMLCAATGVDVHTVLDAAASKPFGFMPFRAGPGTGGRCIPLATEYLAAAQRSAGLTPRLTQAAMTVNQAMPDFVVRRLERLLAGQGRPIAGARVLIVGLAYKSDVADARNSSAAALVRSLRRAGAIVQGYDELIPVFEVDGRPLEMPARLSEVLEPVDAAILHTHHRDLDEAELTRAARIVLDTRGTLNPVADNVHRL